MVAKKLGETTKIGVVDSEISPVTVLPSSEISLTDPIPEDRETCLQSICSNIIDAMRHTTIRFWVVGRIIQTMMDRGERNVIEEVMTRTGYEKRTIQYAVSVYNAVQDAETIKKLCTQGTEWSHFKQLIKIKDENSRKLLVQNIIDGTVKPSVVLSPDAVAKPESSKKADKAKAKTAVPEVKDPAAFIFENFTAPTKALTELLKTSMIEFPNYVELVSDEERVSKTGYDKFMVSAKEFIEAGEVLVQQLQAVKEAYNTSLFEVS